MPTHQQISITKKKKSEQEMNQMSEDLNDLKKTRVGK